MSRHRVARADEIPARAGLIVDVGGVEIGLFRVGERVAALRNVCPHMAAPVCRGTVAGTTLPSAVYEYEYEREGEILQCPCRDALMLVDTDVHNDLGDLTEHLPRVWHDRWRRVGTGAGSVHEGNPRGVLRRDAGPPGGGPPASDPEFRPLRPSRSLRDRLRHPHRSGRPSPRT